VLRLVEHPAIGIRLNIDPAKNALPRVSPGIVVGDDMRTADPTISRWAMRGASRQCLRPGDSDLSAAQGQRRNVESGGENAAVVSRDISARLKIAGVGVLGGRWPPPPSPSLI
jgi:NAD(P)H-nitrite reductase large subunit